MTGMMLATGTAAVSVTHLHTEQTVLITPQLMAMGISAAHQVAQKDLFLQAEMVIGTMTGHRVMHSHPAGMVVITGMTTEATATVGMTTGTVAGRKRVCNSPPGMQSSPTSVQGTKGSTETTETQTDSHIIITGMIRGMSTVSSLC